MDIVLEIPRSSTRTHNLQDQEMLQPFCRHLKKNITRFKEESKLMETSAWKDHFQSLVLHSLQAWVVPETTENYALLQCQEQETQYGCCVASHSWQSECFHALPILPGVFICQKIAATVSLMTKREAGLVFPPDTVGFGCWHELCCLHSPSSKIRQEFSLMHGQAKNLLWEAKFFYGR